MGRLDAYGLHGLLATFPEVLEDGILPKNGHCIETGNETTRLGRISRY